MDSSFAETSATVPLRVSSAAGRWVIAAAVLGSGVAAIDATVVGIALPAIGREFGVGVSSLQWVVTGYAVTLAGLLLLGGALGDRYGRRRVFLFGVAWFAVASLLCGVAPDSTTLTVARALQGVGGALLTPGSLAILQASFAPEDRSRAIGAWSGLGGVATAAGPLAGGYLVGAVSWRWVFFVNLPLTAAVIAISLRHVPESRDPAAGGRPDVPGALAVTLGLIGLTYGFIQGPSTSWTEPSVLAALVLGAAALLAVVPVERRIRHPMLPLTIFASRQFNAANVVTFLVYGALGGALFLVPIELQQVSGYSPIAAGSALLPVTALMLMLSARSSALAARIGPRLQMSVGPVLVAVGLALLARIDAEGTYAAQVLPAVLVFGFGLAVTVAPLTATVLAAAPTDNAGVASAFNNAVARAAGALAVATLPAAAGITGATYLSSHAFESGFRTTMLLAAGLCAVGGLVAALTIEDVSPPVHLDAHPVYRHCPLDAPPLRPDVTRTGQDAPVSVSGPELFNGDGPFRG
jgi:EmrB/QacA subfamily drug resistance transporter